MRYNFFKPVFGQDADLQWSHALHKESRTVSKYTFQYCNENLENTFDLETVIPRIGKDVQSFRYTHNNLIIGKNYYRVKIEYTNGDVAYSKDKAITIKESKKGIAIAPNPALDFIKTTT